MWTDHGGRGPAHPRPPHRSRLLVPHPVSPVLEYLAAGRGLNAVSVKTDREAKSSCMCAAQPGGGPARAGPTITDVTAKSPAVAGLYPINLLKSHKPLGARACAPSAGLEEAGHVASLRLLPGRPEVSCMSAPQGSSSGSHVRSRALTASRPLCKETRVMAGAAMTSSRFPCPDRNRAAVGSPLATTGQRARGGVARLMQPVPARGPAVLINLLKYTKIY